MFAVMLTLFVLVCLILMVVVLLQSSKGGGLAGAFGGGGSDSSVMGGRGTASFLGKVTVYLASAFMVLSLILAVLSSRVGTDEDEGVIARRQQAGTLDVFEVEESGNILTDFQSEGLDLESAGSVEGGEAQSEESGTNEAPPVEPAPAGSN